MVSYFLGGAAGAAIGGIGAQRDGWTGLAAVGAMLGLLAFAASVLGYCKAYMTAATDEV